MPPTHELEGDDAIATLRRTGWGQLARDAVQRFIAADGTTHARSLGYQIMLTAMPALIGIVGLTNTLDQGSVREGLEGILTGLAPGPTGSILRAAFKQGSQGGSTTTAAVIGLGAALVAATVAMGQVERGANRIYGIEQDRSVHKKYALAFLLACTAGVLNFGALLLLVGGSALADAIGWGESLSTGWSIARWPLVVVLVLIEMSLLFRISPRRHQPSASWLAAGSAVAVVLWLSFTGLLAAYLSLSSSFGTTYGPLAGLIGLLLWSFLTSLALLLGLAFAAQLEAVRAGEPNPQTDEDEELSGDLAPAR